MTAQPHDLLVGSLSTEQRATIETPAPVTPATFPRADESTRDGYYADYRHFCRQPMRAWVAREVVPFFELCELTRETIAEDERDALLVAECMATEELRRQVNTNEIRLLGEIVRDVLCAAIITQDTEHARQAELSREVL